MPVVLITGASGLIGSEAAVVLLRQGLRHRRRRQRHAALLLRRRGQHLVAPDAARAGPARLPARARRHPRRRRDGSAVCALRARHRARHPRRGAAVARLGGARADHRFHRQRQRHAEPARGRRGATAPDAPFIFTSTNKVYGDTPNRPAARRTRDALGARRRSPVRGPRHRRNDEHRPDDAQRVRRLEGGGRRDGAGVRPVLRPEDGVLPRRLPDRPGAFRRRAARVSLVSREMRGHRAALHGLRLQGQAGPRQHPLLRSGERVLALLQRPAQRRGLQHRRRPGVELLDARGHRDRRAADRAAHGVDVQRHEPRRRPHLVGQRHPPVRRPLSRSGHSPTRSSARSRRSSTRWRRAPARRADH